MNNKTIDPLDWIKKGRRAIEMYYFPPSLPSSFSYRTPFRLWKTSLVDSSLVGILEESIYTDLSRRLYLPCSGLGLFGLFLENDGTLHMDYFSLLFERL